MSTERDGNHDLRELLARMVVLETIQTQLLLRISKTAADPNAFLKATMLIVENTLHTARNQATPETAQAAKDAVDFFNDYSMRLISAVTPQGKPQ